MKYIFIFIAVFSVGCNSVEDSIVGIKPKLMMAYIYSYPLVPTKSCSGESLVIVGVRQEGRAAIELQMHGIYVPEGKNYIYYNKESEGLREGKCEISQEILVRHSEVKLSKFEVLPWGEELEVNVKAGGNYLLFIENGKVVVKEVEY